MWPGASPAWRKRQQATKPRFGINIKLPKSSLNASGPSLISTGSTFSTEDPLLISRRQLDGGYDEAGNEGVDGAATYNDGLWTPPAVTSMVSPTPPAITPTISLATASDMNNSDLMTTTTVPASTLTDSVSIRTMAASRTAPRPSSTSTSSLSVSSSSTSSSSGAPSPTDRPHDEKGGGGFKLIYLTPILVFVGLFLVFSVVGRMWGRYHHASRVEAARRAKYDKRASRQAKKREMQRIKTMWGYDQTPILPPELEPGEHDLHYKDPNGAISTKKHVKRSEGDVDSSFGSDSESGESGKSSEVDERYPGTFKILSLALLGEGSKSAPPETRGAGGRNYETGVQSNGWLAVKIRRWVGGDEKNLIEDDMRYTTGPSKTGTRRMRHTLSRDRLRGSSATKASSKFDEKALHSPTSTLSVGSEEMKHKAEFSAVEQANGYSHIGSKEYQNQLDDPFLTSNGNSALGWRKPLPPHPKDSPFRPTILNFGLRSRSKQYDAIEPREEFDTPVKRAPMPNEYIHDSSAGFLPKTFGLGISGVWKTITGLANPSAGGARLPTEDDEESFVGRPYRAHSDAVMSESDTPYSIRDASAYPSHGCYGDMGTPTKSRQLERAGTVLNVKSTNQPWNKQPYERAGTPPSAGRKMTGAAWHEALLASPVNKQQQHVFQPLVQPQPSSPRPERNLNMGPRKSLLLHQAVTSAAAAADVNLTIATSPAPSSTGYSDLVACYSTPSDAIMSPVESSIRVLSPPPAARSGNTALSDGSVGARQKLQRAKTAKYEHDERGQSSSDRMLDGDAAMAGKLVQRSKTASTNASAARSEIRLGRKGTAHHSERKGASKVLNDDAVESEGLEQACSALNASPFTQPLRVAKQPALITSPVSCYSSASSPGRGLVSIPTRASSASPTKPSTAIFPSHRSGSTLPSALKIASPEPLTSHLAQHPALSLPLLSHPHYQPQSCTSPPKRVKAVSNRSNASADDEDENDETTAGNHIAAAARSAAHKAHNRITALQAVDEIVYQGYAQHR